MPWKLTGQKIQLSEKDVIKACKQFLQYRGYMVVRQHVGHLDTSDGSYVPVGVVGLPDYSTMHAIYPGFWVEFKRPGGRLSPKQEAKLREIQSCRLAAVCVDSVEKLQAWLNDHEKRAIAQAVWLHDKLSHARSP